MRLGEVMRQIDAGCAHCTRKDKARVLSLLANFLGGSVLFRVGRALAVGILPLVVRSGHRVGFANAFSGFLLEGRSPMARTRIPLSQAEEASRSLRERLEMSTAEIGLSVRTTNCLEERGIFTVRDLLNCNRDDLLSISNFGEKTLEEVFEALEQIGFPRQRSQSATV
jgi:DNA-directed RNA polymerase subunit alpha